MAVNADKMKALQLTMDRLDKTYGKGTVMKLGDEVVEKIDAIPSGSLNLDLALGIGPFSLVIHVRRVDDITPCAYWLLASFAAALAILAL